MNESLTMRYSSRSERPPTTTTRVPRTTCSTASSSRPTPSPAASAPHTSRTRTGTPRATSPTTRSDTGSACSTRKSLIHPSSFSKSSSFTYFTLRYIERGAQPLSCANGDNDFVSNLLPEKSQQPAFTTQRSKLSLC